MKTAIFILLEDIYLFHLPSPILCTLTTIYIFMKQF